MDKLTLSQNNPIAEYSFGGSSGTTMVPLPEIVQFSLRIAPQNLAQAAKCFGAAIPQKVGEIAQSGQSLSLCLGPDEFQLRFSGDLVNPLTKNFAHLQNSVPHSFVDISHRSVSIEIAGPLAAQIIATGCPLDIEAQPVSTCARSILDKVPVTILKWGENQFELEFFRSMSPFAWQFLENAARQREAERLVDFP